MHPYGFNTLSRGILCIRLTCGFRTAFKSYCLCRSAWSRHTHVIRIHNTAIYESVFCGFRCYLFARLYCMISKWIIEGWEIKTDKHEKMKNKRLASLRDTLLHVSRMERSFFLPLHLCYSGLYRFCFSRSDGCGLLKASTHRPKNCSVTMGTGVNQEFMTGRGFQFTTAKCVRTCETPSLSLYFQGEIPMHGNVIWVQFFGYGRVYSHEELRSSVSNFSSFSAWFS